MSTTTRGLGILTSLLLVGASLAFAEPTGSQLMQAVFDRPQGDDMSGTLTMTLVDSRGKERVRTIKQVSASFKAMDKKLMVFQSPADVRGTSFMNWSYDEKGKSDDQWIYLPALKRVKRISSEGKADSFMGSDFTYDDLGYRQPAMDTHRLTGSENVDGAECWVVESVPVDTSENYSRFVTWISKETSMGVKREYYDRRGSLLKILAVRRIERISGIYVILETEMSNVQKSTKTRMVFSGVSINTGMSEDDFTERAMTRGL